MSFRGKEQSLIEGGKFEHLVDFLRTNWQIPSVTRIVDYSTGGYFGGVQKIELAERDFALKRNDLDFERKLVFQHKVFSHLKDKGVEVFPAPFPCKHGDTFVRNEDGIWVLSDWIGGETLRYIPLDSREKCLNNLARALAEFHKATSDFQADDGAIVDHRMTELWIPELLERREKVASLISTGKLPSFLQSAKSRIDLFMVNSEELATLISDFAKIDAIEDALPKNVIHADLNWDHVIFSQRDNNHCYFVDFDRIRFGRRIDDVVGIVIDAERLGKGMGKLFLEEYMKLSPLTDHEISNMDFMIKYGVTRRMFWLLNEIIDKANPLSSYPLDLNEELDWANEVLTKDKIISN